MELPRILPNAVSQYKGPSGNLFRYQSDSRVETRVTASCSGANLSFEVKYQALDNAQLGKFLCFFTDVGVDYDARISLESFAVPRNHPLWSRVDFFQRLEQCWMWADSIDEARWLVSEPSTVSVPLCGFNDVSFRLEEVIDI